MPELNPYESPQAPFTDDIESLPDELFAKEYPNSNHWKKVRAGVWTCYAGLTLIGWTLSGYTTFLVCTQLMGNVRSADWNLFQISMGICFVASILFYAVGIIQMMRIPKRIGVRRKLVLAFVEFCLTVPFVAIIYVMLSTLNDRKLTNYPVFIAILAAIPASIFYTIHHFTMINSLFQIGEFFNSDKVKRHALRTYYFFTAAKLIHFAALSATYTMIYKSDWEWIAIRLWILDFTVYYISGILFVDALDKLYKHRPDPRAGSLSGL